MKSFFLAFLILGAHLAAGGIETIQLQPVEGMARAELHYLSDIQSPLRGVLVLAPGVNSDGSFFLKEQAWIAFARKHDLGLMALSFASPPKDIKAHRGYYQAKLGSGELLLEGVRLAYGKHYPLLLFGFSGGAQFTSRFVEHYPDETISWCAYSASWWDAPTAAEKMPPGIVACGLLDHKRYTPSMTYFMQGRRLDKPWAWVSLADTAHQRHELLEDFVRSFFASILDGDLAESTYHDIETKEALSEEAVLFKPNLAVWLPNKDLLASWRSLHQP